MKELSERQWSDVAPRLVNRPCATCGKNLISHEQRYVEIGGIDMLITTCVNCGHVELFNVAMVSEIADTIDEEYHKIGWR